MFAAIVFTDYLCPWCYLGTARTPTFERLGVAVSPRPYELHPEIPAAGSPVRPGGRYERVLTDLGNRCAEAGLPFTRPTRSPNTAEALALAETVRVGWPEAFEALDADLWRAHWVDGRALDSRQVLDAALDGVGLAPGEVWAALDEAGGVRAVLDRWRRTAHEAGVTGTPTWVVEETLVIPGVQDDLLLERWITRWSARRADTPS